MEERWRDFAVLQRGEKMERELREGRGLFAQRQSNNPVGGREGEGKDEGIFSSLTEHRNAVQCSKKPPDALCSGFKEE
ncbi:hypothetical protein WR25_09399 [Diploscapter pachys]|uniref:Uncharacterized protein n=1 Tax=Diploscapter pachys TaxID=2018661 RepID=A0A2A2JUC6_9BILA|nr:hypothetical protein WR25_09399 [Diploscapter pachys]